MLISQIVEIKFLLNKISIILTFKLVHANIIYS